MRLRWALIILLSVVLVVLTADTIRLKMQNPSKGIPPKEQGFWSQLIEEGRARRAQERKEKQMATISVVVALMGLTAAGYSLYRCRRMRSGLSRLESGVLTSEQKHQLFEGVAAVHPLQTQLDQLRRSLNEELQKLRSSGSQLDEKATQIEHTLDEFQVAGNQLDDRVTQIEKACSGLGAMSEDLDTLKDFSENTERLHNRLREALNGNSVKPQPLASKPQIGLSRRA